MRRKGISPIIASVLLLAISISIAGLYSNWAPEYAESTIDRMTGQVEDEMRCDNADLRIENAEYDPNVNETYVELANTGTITFNQDLVGYTLISSQVEGENQLSNLQVGETREFSITTNQTPDTVVALSNNCPEIQRSTSEID